MLYDSFKTVPTKVVLLDEDTRFFDKTNNYKSLKRYMNTKFSCV